MEHADEEQVKRDIDKGRNDEVLERVLTIAGRLKDTHTDIIEDEGEGAGEIRSEIADGIRENGFGRAHEPEHDGREPHAHDGQQRSGDETEGEQGMDGFLHTLTISCAVIACDDDACAHGDAVDQTDHQEDQVTGGADGGEGFAAQKVTDDQRVCRIIQLLEEVTQKQGQGKGDDALRDRAFRQRGGGMRRMKAHEANPP